MSGDEEVIPRVESLFSDALGIGAPSLETDIIETGLLDSLALVELLAELEREFDIEIPLDELDIESFRTVKAIAAFVTQCKRVNGGEAA